MNQITEELVWNEIVNRLKTASCLGYVKAVYEGGREGYTDGNKPYLLLEWPGDEEIAVEMPNRKKNTVILIIRGGLDIRNRLDNQIVGDDTQVGALRFKNDIMKAFEDSDIRFSNNVISHNIKTLSSRNINNSIREVVLQLTITFKYFDAESRT